MDLGSNVTVFRGGSRTLSDLGGASQMEDDFVLCSDPLKIAPAENLKKD